MDAINLMNRSHASRRKRKTPDVHLMKPLQSDVFEMHGHLDEFIAVTAPVTRWEMQKMISQILLPKDLSKQDRLARESKVRENMHLLTLKLFQRLRMKKLTKSKSHLTVWATDSEYPYNEHGIRRDFVHLTGVEKKKFRRGGRSAYITIAGQVQTFVELRGFKAFMQSIGPGVVCTDQTGPGVTNKDLMELVLVRYLAPHPHCTHPLTPSTSPACGSLPLVHGLWEFAKTPRTARQLHRRVSFETYLRRQLEPAGSTFTAVPPTRDAGRAWYGLHVVQAIKNIMDIGIASGIDPPGLLECVVRY